jgi:excisionase family DNA binding protein
MSKPDRLTLLTDARRALDLLYGQEVEAVERANTPPAKLRYTLAEVAELTGISASTLYKRLRRGEIRPCYVGTSVGILHEDLMYWLHQQREETPCPPSANREARDETAREPSTATATIGGPHRLRSLMGAAKDGTSPPKRRRGSG